MSQRMRVEEEDMSRPGRAERKREDLRMVFETDRTKQRCFRLTEHEVDMLVTLKVRRAEAVSKQLGEALASIAQEGWKGWAMRNPAIHDYMRKDVDRACQKVIALSESEDKHRKSLVTESGLTQSRLAGGIIYARYLELSEEERNAPWKPRWQREDDEDRDARRE
jgi:hypothetical protein